MKKSNRQDIKKLEKHAFVNPTLIHLLSTRKTRKYNPSRKEVYYTKIKTTERKERKEHIDICFFVSFLFVSFIFVYLNLCIFDTTYKLLTQLKT